MKEIWKKHSYGIITTLTIIVLLVFSYQVMAYLFSLRKDPPKRPPMVAARSVHIQKVQYGSVTSPVIRDGRVVSKQEIVVSTEVRGKILEGDVPFKIGQQFKKGDILIKIFDENAQLDLSSRKSSFLQRIAQILPDLKIDFADNYQKWMDFFNAIDINKNLPDLPDINSDKEKIFVASRNILSDYYSIRSDEVTLEKHTIKAPFNGSFTDVLYQVGAIANTGAQLARIIRTDQLEIEVPVEPEDVIWIKINDNVEIISGDGSIKWTGKVVRKADFVNTNTQSMSVFISVKASAEKPLFAGQYLKAYFMGNEINNVMEISRNAVFNHNEVFIVIDGKLVKRTIDIQKVNEKTLIFSGLEEGIELVIEPLVGAMENSPVKIIR
ncbi:efflux RND transporter periplasmic adaptor subunit [candidate division KSB1 bacterium]